VTQHDYELLDSQVRALIADEPDALARAATTREIQRTADLLHISGRKEKLYLTRDTYSFERVSTLITSP